MDFHYAINLKNLKISPERKTVIDLLAETLIVFLFSFFIAKSFLPSLWINYTNECHTTIELLCAFIAFTTFITVWNVYESNKLINQIIGFAFLMIAIFIVFHAYFSINLDIGHSDQRLHQSIYCMLLSQITATCIILLASFKASNLKINKWAGLLVTLAITFCSLFPVFKYPNLLVYEYVNFFNQNVSYILIIVSCICLYRLKSEINNRDLLTYRYIFIAAIITILSQICFISYQTIHSFYNILSHFLKAVSYYYLFKGIFISSITYPYDKLERTSEFITNIIDYLPIGLITYNSNLDITFSNKKTEKILGYKREDIQKKQLFAELVSQDGKQVKDYITSIKNNFGKEVKVKVNSYRLENEEIIAMFSDAREEQELENLQLQTKAILDSIENPVLIFDHNRKIIAVNNAFKQVTKVDLETAIGSEFNRLKRLLQFKKNKSNRDKFYEASIVTLLGDKKELLIHTAPVKNISGEFIGSIVFVWDITSNKEEQDKLYQQEKLAALGQMAAGIVHEIKNPLTTIKGFCQLINFNTENEKVKRYTRTIEEEVSDMNKVVSEFLNFAKPQPPILKEIELNELIKSMLILLESHCFIKGIEISFIFHPDQKTIMADESQLKQVVLNIVENAIDAVCEAQEPNIIITTGLVQENNETFIAIKDNGHGMSEMQKNKVGIPFFTTKDKGTGLGLSICYQIIKEHNGRIVIESKEGKGTTFNIYLPTKEKLLA